MAQSYTVGPPGDNLRSDLRVTYTTLTAPLSIEIESKVQALFGEALQKQSEAICRDLSVQTGKLNIEDFGALPFVVAARIEAVLREAHPDMKQEHLPHLEEHCKVASFRDRFRRSRQRLQPDL